MELDIFYFKSDKKICCSLPAKFVICKLCEGFGSKANSICFKCNGTRVTKEINESALNKEQKIHFRNYQNYLDECYLLSKNVSSINELEY